MIDFSKIKTYPISQRKNLEKISDFSKIGDEYEKVDTVEMQELCNAIVGSYKNKKQVILMMGGHVVKTGQTPYIIDLMKKGVITHIAVNGAFTIHDFEIALIGETSEDVATTLETGMFGMAEETGKYLNSAIKQGSLDNIGYGEAIGRKIEELNCKYKEYSVVYHAYKLGIPFSVHVAIGTDIIHQHPTCDGEAIGKTSYHDFKLFTETLTKLEGGVCINLGSAVIMPEVFLKVLTIARNLEYKVEKFTTANLDQIDHYRPRVNVVQRPTSIGGKGHKIIATHQRTVPTIYHGVLKGIGK